MIATQPNIPPPLVRQKAVNPPPSCWEKITVRVKIWWYWKPYDQHNSAASLACPSIAI